MERALMATRGLAPLRRFYRHRGLPFPPVTKVQGVDLPDPVRRLLYHDADMTSQLQEYCRRPIVLRILQKRQASACLEREVVLMVEEDGRPIEYGAIRIYLDSLPPAAQEEVLASERPLGAVLLQHQVVYNCSPHHFFSLLPDASIQHALEMEQPVTLFGRCNLLTTATGDPLAEVVEILPPFPALESMERRV